MNTITPLKADSMLINLFLCLSANRQTAAHYSPRTIQSDTWGGQCGTIEVSSIWRPHPFYQLAERWSQSFGKGSSNVLARTGQPADQKHQGNKLQPLCFTTMQIVHQRFYVKSQSVCFELIFVLISDVFRNVCFIFPKMINSMIKAIKR